VRLPRRMSGFDRSFDHLVGADEQRLHNRYHSSCRCERCPERVASLQSLGNPDEPNLRRVAQVALRYRFTATGQVEDVPGQAAHVPCQWNAAVETVEAPAYELIRPRCVSSAGIESLICGVQRGPRHYRPPRWSRPTFEPSGFSPTMSGADVPCTHFGFGD
jgi:hypothetical protein